MVLRQIHANQLFVPFSLSAESDWQRELEIQFLFNSRPTPNPHKWWLESVCFFILVIAFLFSTFFIVFFVGAFRMGALVKRVLY